ncbi:hypothetical protein BpHYR1_040300 [Brachionus plicatilis]|uniref:Uncharacterized protein n=1 Tax=Brachionus plicatilis TaxID=10195 RepID=A0A3M7RW24_BRAPC|nr:hypothetical protein BpHYR1_040300 [Brachionus plicatilis]
MAAEKCNQSTMHRSKFWKLKKDTLLNIYKTLIGWIKTIQNISIKSIYHFPFGTPSDLLDKAILELIKDYVGAFVNSSKICSNITPLCGIWNEINEWMIENGKTMAEGGALNRLIN